MAPDEQRDTDEPWTRADLWRDLRAAVDPCGEVHRGDCRGEDDGTGATEARAPVRRRR